MTRSVDARHFQDLAAMDHDAVCRRALCGYEKADGSYILSVWGDEYRVCPSRSTILRVRDGREDVDLLFGLFIVQYLLTAKDIPIMGGWISEKDIPGGSAFFVGPHAIPTHLLTDRFGNSLGDFCERCEHLQGTPLDMASRAYSFRVAPRIPVAVLLWEGDDEFPAESRLLFDRTIGKHLALDVIFGLAVEVCTRIAESNAAVKTGPGRR